MQQNTEKVAGVAQTRQWLSLCLFRLCFLWPYPLSRFFSCHYYQYCFIYLLALLAYAMLLNEYICYGNAKGVVCERSFNIVGQIHTLLLQCLGALCIENKLHCPFFRLLSCSFSDEWGMSYTCQALIRLATAQSDRNAKLPQFYHMLCTACQPVWIQVATWPTAQHRLSYDGSLAWPLSLLLFRFWHWM